MTAAEAKRIIHPDTTVEALAEIEYYGGFSGEKAEIAAVDEACLVACVALDKQIPENHFQNECECVVDYGMLYKSIDNKCRSQNCYLHNEYRIVLRNGYPTVCINRQRCYVHILIGELVYGKIRKGYVIHHKDKNKLNAMPNNLELMTSYKHSKIHGEERKGIDLRSEEGKQKSINAAAKARKRSDVTIEKVEKLRRNGFTIPEIAKELNCGVNTVSRRLGMKDY